MTAERIRQITAEQLMGWEWKSWGSAGHAWTDKKGRPHTGWRPDQDREQSRMVVKKALERQTAEALTSKLSISKRTAWIFVSPRDECEAALKALGLWEEDQT